MRDQGSTGEELTPMMLCQDWEEYLRFVRWVFAAERVQHHQYCDGWVHILSLQAEAPCPVCERIWQQLYQEAGRPILSPQEYWDWVLQEKQVPASQHQRYCRDGKVFVEWFGKALCPICLGMGAAGGKTEEEKGGVLWEDSE